MRYETESSNHYCSANIHAYVDVWTKLQRVVGQSKGS